MNKYNIITLCGSAKFKDDFDRASKELTLDGNVVISVGFFEQSCETITSEQKIMLGDIHKRKIDLADEIFVINKDNYIGQSTRREIAYAFVNGKKINFLENPKCEKHSWSVIDSSNYKDNAGIEMCANCHELRYSGLKIDNRLYLKIPTIDELDYRIKLLADPDTMEYNKGYGDDDSGCYYLTKEKAEKWYNYWTQDPKRYYAYIVKKDGDIPIGDVNIHFDKDYNLNMIGIVIEVKHRGKGYSEEALRLLADVAFYHLRLDSIFDCLPHDRPIAEKAFTKVGFIWTDNDILLLTKERYESINKR